MEVQKSNAATLSNYEVMVHLQKLKNSKQKHEGQLATITYETLKYLEGTPCKQQNPSSIRACIKALEQFNLSKSEKLMLINTPATSPLDIQLMIEDSEERLTEDQVQEIINIMQQHFPHIVPTKMETEEPEEVSN